jgi:hypothetical protein
MKTFISLVLAAGLAIGTASTAVARQGCGPGAHRGPYGHCRPNVRGTRVVVTPHGFVVGRYYRGRGYWDGRRWWQHRRQWRNAWRYY